MWQRDSASEISSTGSLGEMLPLGWSATEQDPRLQRPGWSSTSFGFSPFPPSSIFIFLSMNFWLLIMATGAIYWLIKWNNPCRECDTGLVIFVLYFFTLTTEGRRYGVVSENYLISIKTLMKWSLKLVIVQREVLIVSSSSRSTGKD